jgi:hypothetical protein
LLAALTFPPLLLSLIFQRGFATRILIHSAFGRLFCLHRPFGTDSSRASPYGRCFGSLACSVKAPFDPTGRRSTTPGLAIVAATIAGSDVSFAKP